MADSNVMIPAMGSIFANPIGGTAYDAATVAWWDQVRANGGYVSAARLGVINTFIVSEKNYGLWDLTDDYLPLAGEDAGTGGPQSLTSLKQRRLVTLVNAPVGADDRGYTFDGATSYGVTGFIASTHAVAGTLNSFHLESYERTNVNNNSPIGVISGANQINTQPRNSGNLLVGVLGAGAVFTLGTATSVGLSQSGRSGSGLTDVYGARNGVDLTRTSAYVTLASALPSIGFFIGGVNSGGSLSQAKATQLAYAAWGAALTGTQRLVRYNNVQAWMTSIGANV